jgi:hypothetical protein
LDPRKSRSQTKKKIAEDVGKGWLALRGFFAGVAEAQESRLWATLDGLTNERNLIAHGVWMIDATGAVAVIWHSRFLESDE